jgi:uncharacterized protein YndB with AHSA1/START domain
MTPTHTIDVAREIDAPALAVWNRVSNHEQTHTWIREVRVRLVSEGTPERNGMNAVREVSFPDHRFWPVLQERIVAFDAPHRFSYKIIAGQPGLRDHLGTVSVESLGPQRCRLSWHIDFEYALVHPFRLIASSVTRNFGELLKAALAEIARQEGGEVKAPTP